jgi:ABC-type amino acid transport system permease subunit
MGLTQFDVLRYIVLPQAVRSVIPTLGNLSVDLIKDTSIATTISVMEITGTASALISKFAQPIPIFLTAAVCYLVLTVPTSIVFRRLEKAHRIIR